MTETDILDLVQARHWLVLAGAIIMALVTALRTYAARAGWTGVADKAVSVASSYLQDLSIMLPAFGYDLWPWALLAAFRGVLMSGGLSELLAMLTTKKPPTTPTETPRTTQKTPRETPLPTPTASSGASSTLRMAVVVGAAAVLVGCSGAQLVPDPNPNDGIEPCSVERSIVDSLGNAVEAVDTVVPDDSPKAVEGLTYARAGVTEGEAAVAACEALTAEGHSGLSAVLPWISVAANIVRGLMAILMAAGVDIPDEVQSVLHSLGLSKADVDLDPGSDVAKTPIPIARYAPAYW